MISWEKNPEYPTSFTTCRVCGDEGLKKQAWDLQGYLCVDAKSCLSKITMSHGVLILNNEVDDKEEIRIKSHDAKTSTVTIESTVSDLQWFNCNKCHKMWSRPSTRGRPPKICQECR